MVCCSESFPNKIGAPQGAAYSTAWNNFRYFAVNGRFATSPGHQVNSTEVVKSVWREGAETGSSHDSYCRKAFN